MATKTEFTKAIQEKLAEEGGIFEDMSLKDAKAVYEAVLAAMFDELIQPNGKVPFAGICNITNKEVPAKDARMGRNPATGEPLEIPAKPATVKLRMSQLKAHREAAAEEYESLNKPKKRRSKGSKSTSRKAKVSTKKAAKKGSKSKVSRGKKKGRKVRRH